MWTEILLMTVSGGLLILASELVERTQKWDAGSCLAEKLGEKIPSEKLRVQ